MITSDSTVLRRLGVTVPLTLAVIALAGCGGSTRTITTTITTSQPAATSPMTNTTSQPAATRPTTSSDAKSNSSCHARGRGLYMLPDPRCTPGATNPAVTQANIDSTICKAGWSESQRPPESVTEEQKRLSLAAYGYYEGRSLHTYEFDHLIPLELGGASDSPRNLWPEPDYPGVSDNSYYLNPKDHVEDELHDWVCSGKISLAAAQHIMATNWISWYREHIGPTTTAPGAQPGKTTPATAIPRPKAAATCSVSGSYNGKYHDFDVYVHSSQPDDKATVTDAGGASASYYTDSSGYADVYLSSPANASGERVSARVGPARCSGRL